MSAKSSVDITATAVAPDAVTGASTVTPADTSQTTVIVRIHRFDGHASWQQDYRITVPAHTSLLDCLLLIKRTQDPSLAFRYSCGHGMCGSDAVSIDGIPRLLCLTKISDVQKDAEAQANGISVITLAPLPAFSPVRDLIVNLNPMLDQIRRLEPYLRASDALRTTPSGAINVFEYLQHPDELEAFDQLTNCIACGVCEGACPIYVDGTPFVGPAAAVAAGRFIFDSRDDPQSRAQRLAALDHTANDPIDTASSSNGAAPAGIWPCKGLRFCTQRCPRGIDVSGAIWKIMQAIKENRGRVAPHSAVK
ncbi:MAG: 2Fe-2S iron-sulfur cluster-binding protein [Bifidobacteriaceae bacterium]|jgi:succinate dehydrogenase / fumarate reductase iron-sulfur subunit|nr:2Fe-2S iron-sulfur cluster-binding protein [Bifidobacteriaceae bacterium]